MSSLEITLSVLLYCMCGVSTLLWICYDDLRTGKHMGGLMGSISIWGVILATIVMWPLPLFVYVGDKLDWYFSDNSIKAR